MDRNDWLSSHDASTLERALGLLLGRMYGLQPAQPLSEVRTQSLICSGLVEEEGVATARGDVEGIQKRGSWGLPFVCDVTVPSYGVGSRCKEISRAIVLGSTMDEMNLGIACRGPRCWVDVQTAKVAPKVESF